MNWNTIDLVALSLVSRKHAADRIGVTRNYPTFLDAVQSLDFHEESLIAGAQSIIDDCDRLGVHVIGWGDDRYPSRLRSVLKPPLVIYVWGTLPDPSWKSVAVVGTRTCTTLYGKPATDALVKRWVEVGLVIVSGLANGIDTLAHEACLRMHGTTVAVIASGMNRILPQTAERLAHMIVDEGGAVISEYPPHVAALPHYFPARNRIINGVSDAVVVIESKESGGALITADFAIENGRPVWAVPGPITSSRSIGTNALIRDGKARILTSADDLLESLGLSAGDARRRPLPTDLALLGGEELGIDEIARRWTCSVSEALTRMAEHEFAGFVRQLPGQRFVTDS